MIKNVALTFKWTPTTINELYLDDYDHFGLVYWNNEAEKQADELKKITTNARRR